MALVRQEKTTVGVAEKMNKKAVVDDDKKKMQTVSSTCPPALATSRTLCDGVTDFVYVHT